MIMLETTDKNRNSVPNGMGIKQNEQNIYFKELLSETKTKEKYGIPRKWSLYQNVCDAY